MVRWATWVSESCNRGLGRVAFLLESLGEDPLLAFPSLTRGLILHLQSQQHNISKSLSLWLCSFFLPHVKTFVIIRPIEIIQENLTSQNLECNHIHRVPITVQTNMVQVLGIMTWASLGKPLFCLWHLVTSQPLYHILQFIFSQKYGLDCISVAPCGMDWRHW